MIFFQKKYHKIQSVLMTILGAFSSPILIPAIVPKENTKALHTLFINYFFKRKEGFGLLLLLIPILLFPLIIATDNPIPTSKAYYDVCQMFWPHYKWIWRYLTKIIQDKLHFLMKFKQKCPKHSDADIMFLDVKYLVDRTEYHSNVINNDLVWNPNLFEQMKQLAL